jgi:hypothetical protein
MFKVILDGQDLIVDGLCSWFGGTPDPGTGQTASGISLIDNPGLVGCALPLPGDPATNGTPLPHIPFGTMVRVWCSNTKIQVTVPLVDVGPALRTGHVIDLTQYAFALLVGLKPSDLGGTSDPGVVAVKYRILGGAKYLK